MLETHNSSTYQLLGTFKKNRCLRRRKAAQVEVLHKGDFRVMPEDSVAKSFPTLEGAQVSKEVWARTYVPWIWGDLYPIFGEGMKPVVLF